MSLMGIALPRAKPAIEFFHSRSGRNTRAGCPWNTLMICSAQRESKEAEESTRT